MGRDSTLVERSYLVPILEDAGFAPAVEPPAAVEVPAEPELADIVTALIEAGIIEEVEV